MTGDNDDLDYLTILLRDLKVVFSGPSWDAVENRARVLYDYARNTPEGLIVELGTYMGFGAFSLAYGALAGNKNTVYTVDDYIYRTGWAGEQYQPEDENIFFKNFKLMTYYREVHLYHIRLSAEKAVEVFSGIGLLFVDLSPAMSFDLFLKWQDKTMSGGIVLFRDTLTRSLGYDKIVEQANKDIWEVIPEPNPYFMAIRKRVA